MNEPNKPTEPPMSQSARILSKMSEEQKKQMVSVAERLRESLSPNTGAKRAQESMNKIARETQEAAKKRAEHQQKREDAEDVHRARAERYAKIQANSSIIAIILSLIALVVSLFAIFK